MAQLYCETIAATIAVLLQRLMQQPCCVADMLMAMSTWRAGGAIGALLRIPTMCNRSGRPPCELLRLRTRNYCIWPRNYCKLLRLTTATIAQLLQTKNNQNELLHPRQQLLQQLLHSVLASAWLPEVNKTQRWLPQATIATPGTWVPSKWALREFDCATHMAPTLFLQGPACSIECPAAARHRA